ncbi:MAG: ATP-binding protein [Calditrichaeota bacterium]|nr:MAG: ATP-binding protein [Calditrichota bacterium]
MSLQEKKSAPRVRSNSASPGQNSAQEGPILILDNQTEELKRLFKHLLFQNLPVKYTTDPSLVLDVVRADPVPVLIAQALLYHANMDIANFEDALMEAGFRGKLVVVNTDPLVARAIASLKYRYRYYLHSLEDLALVEKMVRILYVEKSTRPLEESDFVERGEVHRLRIPSELSFVEKTTHFILQKLVGFGVDARTKNAIRMALVEALSNAIEHGNKFDLRKQVLVEFRIDRNAFTGVIRDEGEGFDAEAHQSLTEINLSHNERGRGLFIIRKFMDEIRFSKKGNSLLVRKYLNQPEPPAL